MLEEEALMYIKRKETYRNDELLLLNWRISTITEKDSVELGFISLISLISLVLSVVMEIGKEEIKFLGLEIATSVDGIETAYKYRLKPASISFKDVCDKYSID